jgi:hypothetical protein
MTRLVRAGYTRVFVYENPDDRDQIWDYTLSTAEVRHMDLTGSQQRKVPGSIPVPCARIGFLARDDKAPAKLGAGLLVDAARRVLRSDAMTAWGIILEPEGGPANAKLGLVQRRNGLYAHRGHRINVLPPPTPDP